MSAISLSAPAASRSGHSWLVSGAFDGFFFLGSALAVVAAWVAHARFGVKPFHVLAFVAVASNGPHLTSTWTRVYLDRSELRRRPMVFVGVPLLIGVALLWLMAKGPALAPLLGEAGATRAVVTAFERPGRVITSIILYWAVWHFAAQCYGLLRLYQRRSGEPERVGLRAESAFVFAVAAAGLAWRLHFGPTVLFGSPALAPPIPGALVFALLAVVAVCAAFVLADQTRRAATGQGVAWTRMAFLGAVVLGFWVPFMLIDDGTTAFAAAACWHGFQYLGIVWHFNRRRHATSDGQGARLVWWVSQPGRVRVAAYAALLLALAGLAYAVIFAAAWAGGWSSHAVAGFVWPWLTLSHYFIDGLIWKMRKGDVAKTLQAA